MRAGDKHKATEHLAWGLVAWSPSLLRLPSLRNQLGVINLPSGSCFPNQVQITDSKTNYLAGCFLCVKGHHQILGSYSDAWAHWPLLGWVQLVWVMPLPLFHLRNVPAKVSTELAHCSCLIFSLGLTASVKQGQGEVGWDKRERELTDNLLCSREG